MAVPKRGPGDAPESNAMPAANRDQPAGGAAPSSSSM
jgi:hypothetical protein